MGFGLAVVGWADRGVGRKFRALHLVGPAMARGAVLAHGDPCTLLSAAEAATLCGSAGHAAVPGERRRADVHGDQCMYRGKPTGAWCPIRGPTGGRRSRRPASCSAGRGRSTVGSAHGARSGAAGHGHHGAPGREGRERRPVGPGDVDTWRLAASPRRATRSVQVDVSGCERPGAGTRSRWRGSRCRALAHPLNYDGAKAVALVPKPVSPSRAARAISFRASEVEAAIGPLDGDADFRCAGNDVHVSRAHAAGRARRTPVEFVRVAGRPAGVRDAQTHGMVDGGRHDGHARRARRSTRCSQPPQMKTMMGGMMKMVGGSSSRMAPAAAPGAAATVGLRTDTTLVGPWDHAALLHGTQLMAVRHDVYRRHESRVGGLQQGEGAPGSDLLAAVSTTCIGGTFR